MNKRTSVFNAFLKVYHAYANTHNLDDIRAKDFARLGNNIYLDFTGGSLYGQSQLDEHMALLSSGTFGNPHSSNPTSSASTKLAAKSRDAVLTFFNASPQEYTVIFTPNASGALRLVGESFPFAKGSELLQLADNHNSVNGLREFALAKSALVNYIASNQPDLHIDDAVVTHALSSRPQSSPRLFAYPAQSNFSGVQHPLRWIDEAHAQDWLVILDAAAFVPTNRLDLSRYKPDFIPVSFYKMFGWPTGIGCLLARKDSLRILHRPWFAGGSVWAASALGGWHLPAPGAEAYEDGTINYLDLPAVTIGLDYINRMGIDTIHTRVACLTDWLLKRLLTLQHSNRQPLCTVYGPQGINGRGATIALNILTPDGTIIDERIVERAANTRHMSLRTGCFCNPGSSEAVFGISADTLIKHQPRDTQGSFDTLLERYGMQSAGAIRVSLGHISNFDDVAAFVELVESFKDATPQATDLPARGHC